MMGYCVATQYPLYKGRYLIMKVDWKRKLTSRKFWLAVIGFVTPMMVAFGANSVTVDQTTAIIMGGATLIAYIVGEGIADAATKNDKE